MDETAKETVIIVHGTFAAPQPGASQWYQPAEGMPATEGFIAKLDAALQERGSPARCWAHCTQRDPIFQWSGENSWIARTHAASALGDYVAKLQKEGWCCHIVAHSHGGNVVFEALPQIAAGPAIEFEIVGEGKRSLTIGPPLGKIVTLGTPFMDTMSPIIQRIGRNQSFLIGLSGMIVGICGLWFATGKRLMEALELTSSGAVLGAMILFLAAAIVFAFFSSRKTPISNRLDKMQPKFLAIGSKMDEPWQLLHHLRTYPNPMAVKTNIICYLISSMRSHISLRRQLARIYERKSIVILN